MSTKTSIEWTATVHPDGTVTPGKTWNPVTGCDKVSPGCAHCYAEGVAERFWAKQYPAVLLDGTSINKISTSHHEDYLANGLARPRRFTDVMTHEGRLPEPLSWRRPSKVFVNSMSDLFHEDVPDEFIDRVFAVMGLAERHTFQVLTKRPARMRQYMTSRPASPTVPGEVNIATESGLGVYHVRWPLPNVWLGVSVENQHFADERIPLLLQTPAAVRFISAEPLLGPVDLEAVPLPAPGAAWYGLKGVAQPATEKDTEADDWKYWTRRGSRLDWVIVGGESGPGARPFDLEWARSIVAQCKAAGVPVFVKQLGAVPIQNEDEWRAGDGHGRVSLLTPRNLRRTPAGFVPIALGDRKGGAIEEWPEGLRIREFPGAAA